MRVSLAVVVNMFPSLRHLGLAQGSSRSGAGFFPALTFEHLDFVTLNLESRARPHRTPRAIKGKLQARLWWWWVLVSVLCHCGEASNPGPLGNTYTSWSVGIFNSSGLNSKLSQAASLDGEVWLASETHLSQQGVRWFKNGLRGLQSRFSYVVAGAPVDSRSQSAVGGYSGVLAMSSVPLRALPPSIPDDIFRTGRCQVVGFVIQDVWIQAGIMYGYPDSSQHLERTFQTDTILSALVQRIACQTSGPRLIAGDFNHSPDQLSQLDQLKKMGFCEVQHFACHQWGRPISFTTKGDRLIDQIWISRELQS